MGDSSSTTEVGSTEEIVRALLEYLVDPLLPLKATSVRDAPSLSQQESVAKQMHASVILYNYYQCKCQPELQFLDFESFCKLAVTLKPSLMLHMKSIRQFDLAKLDDLENQLSVTENAIMNACSVSRTLLEASKDISSSLREWPIVKVAVLLVDSTKENCLLLFNSVTNGVWSVIEKDIDSESIVVGSKRKRFKTSKPDSSKEHDADDEAGFQNVAFSAVKKITDINRDELKVLESNAVYSLSKEKTAARFYIVQSTQAINEDCRVPIKDAIDSLQGPLVSKSSGSWMVTPPVEYFHLLPYAGIISDWFSSGSIFFLNKLCIRKMLLHRIHPQPSISVLTTAINALVGSKNACGGWILSIEVLFNNLDDRAGMEAVDVNISWSSDKTCKQKLDEAKGVTSNTLHSVKVGLDSVKINSLSTDKPCGREVIETRDSSDKSCTILDGGKEALVAKEAAENHCDKKVMEAGHCGDKQESVAIDFPECNGSHMVDITNSTSRSQSMDIDKNPVVSLPKENITTSTQGAVKVYQSHKRKGTPTPSAEIYKNASTNGMKIQAELVTDLKKEVDLKTESCVNEFGKEKVDTEMVSCVVSLNLDGAQTVERSLVPFELKTSYEEKIQATFASKETALSQTALRVLVRKREKLCNELHNLEDEMHACERNIQTILDGAENSLAIKLEAILDCCNDTCLQSKAQAQYWINQDAENQGLHYPMGKRMSEAILSVQTPCQELNNICCTNNWMLPMFRVTPCDGGFLANATVKGMDFECSCQSDPHPTLDGAKNMAAEQIIAKLRNMASQVQ